MAKKLRVGILFGGRSGEHEVSLLSAASVLKAIDRKKFDVVPIAINKSGHWLTSGAAVGLLEGSAPAIVTSAASGFGPICADSTVNSGRNRLPPALKRCISESVITASALRSSASMSCSIRATPAPRLAANAASPKSMPATTVAGVLTRPTYW